MNLDNPADKLCGADANAMTSRSVTHWADRDAELMRVNVAGESAPLRLAPRCFDEEIFVLREHDAAERRRPVEQCGVGETGGTVLLRGQHVHATPAQPV
jgi:hypothetical protein